MRRLIASLAMALSLAASPALASDVSFDQRNPEIVNPNGSKARPTPTRSDDSSKTQDEGSGSGEVGEPCICPSPSDSPSVDRSSLKSTSGARDEFQRSIWSSP
jgi:hypothetical protein